MSHHLRRRSRTLVAGAAVAVLALTMAACGVKVGDGPADTATGSASPSSTNHSGIIGAEPLPSTSTTTSTTLPPPVHISVHGDDGSATNQTVESAIVDLSAWWAKEYPKVFGTPYRPLTGGYFAIDSSSSVDGLPCAPRTIRQVLENAYYCPKDDAIVWDQEGLMPQLSAKFGSLTPAVVIAHEWGHSIQHRAHFDAATVIVEQQADCYAGAWVKHERTDANARFQVSNLDIDHALAGFLSLRDAPGSTATDANAHGSGFDRVRAFEDGYDNGVERCSKYRDGDPKPYQFAFTDQADFNNNGDLPLEGQDGILALIFPSLDEYWAKEFPTLSGGKAWKAMANPVSFVGDNAPDCNGNAVKHTWLFVCTPDRFIAYDGQVQIPDIYQNGGDFSVGTLFAAQYGIEVQAQLGTTPKDELTTTLRADCYAGVYSAAILPSNDPNASTGLTLSPGDLDEGVGVLLSSSADADSTDQGAGVDRVRAFGIGVTQGAQACATVKPS